MSGKRNPRRQQSQFSEASIPLEELNREWRTVFQRFDIDDDGLIPLREFRRLLENPAVDSELPPEVIDEILERADIDRDGNIDFEEFKEMVKAHELGAAKPMLRNTLRVAAMLVVPKSQRRKTVQTYMSQYSCCPPPFFMPLISIVEIVLFIHQWYTIDPPQPLTLNGPVPWKSVLIYNPYRRYEAWRFVTYMFVHAGLMHITFNVLTQLVLGIPLEMVHHWWRIMIVYFAGVIAGSLGTSVSDPEVYLCGASGGVYAVLAAHLASVILNWSEMEFAVVRLLVLGLFMGSDIGVAVYNRYAGVDTKTGYVAHLAGAIAGLLVGIAVLRNIKIRTWEKVLWWICVAVFIVLMIALICWNVFFPDHFPPPR